MKITHTHYCESTIDLGEYIRENFNRPLTVNYNIDSCRYEVTFIEELTEPEFNMSNLSSIAHDNELTMEQQNAIDYGISAIKTLIDMGVLK